MIVLDVNVDVKDPFPHIIKDNCLDTVFAKNIQEEILNIPQDHWDRYDNPFEQKYTLSSKENLPENCNKLFLYLNSREFIDQLSDIIGVELFPDPTKNFWGIHKYKDGDYLDIHVDAGRHPTTLQKKHVTLGIYLSKDWTDKNGGHLELWQGGNASRGDAIINKCVTRVLPIFNRLVIFTCNDFSWHGNPEPVNCKNGETRIFLTVSYLSNYDKYDNNRVKAFFVPRPNDEYNLEKDQLRFLRSDPQMYKKVYRANVNSPLNVE